MENKEFNYTEEFEKSLKEFSTHGREVLVAEAHFNHMEAVRFCHDYYSLKHEFNDKVIDFKIMFKKDILDAKSELIHIYKLDIKGLGLDDQLQIIKLQNKIQAYNEILNHFKHYFERGKTK